MFQYSREHVAGALRVVIQGDSIGVMSSTNTADIATIMAVGCNCVDLVWG